MSPTSATTEPAAREGAPARIGRWLAARPWLLLPLFALAGLLPLLRGGTPKTFDGALHMLRIASLDRLLRDGVFLPRWQPDLLLGYGYPTLNYYAPASYYLVELFHLGGLSMARAFDGAFALLLLAAGFGMYLFALDSFRGQKGAALVAATAYMLGPYLLLNFYNRGALAEVGAQALLPWLLWSARRLLVDEAPARPALFMALLLAGIVTMHTVSLLFVPPLLVAWLLLVGLQQGRLRRRWRWVVGALVAAMGASAFFWLPLLLERGFLSELAFDIARNVWLPDSVWTWSNFLQTTPVYRISSLRPVQLGLMQVALALVGMVGMLAARRRDAEWIFWIILTLLLAALMAAWSLPIWRATILAAAQFPWRLLSIVSLPLALFAGGIPYAAPAGRWRLAAAGATLALILFAQTPRLLDLEIMPSVSQRFDTAVAAMVEFGKGVARGGEGNSSVQEFRPRWADSTFVVAEQPVTAGAPPRISLHAANAYDLSFDVTTDSATALRFATFYFPGWNVRAAGAADLPTRPDTTLGLLAVDLPAGSHSLRVQWDATALERIATWLSLATWALLALLALFHKPLRRWALIPLLLTGVGLVGLLWARSDLPVQQPLEGSADLGEIRLLGAILDTANPEQASVRPFWQVEEPLPPGSRLHWQLQTVEGVVLSNYRSRPWYNTQNTRNWVVNSIIDDGYLLPLPPGLPAGDYLLAGDLVLGADDSAERLTPLLTLHLPADLPPDPQPERSTTVRFGESIDLTGYTLRVNGRAAAGDTPLLVVEPGDWLEYTLFWRADDAISRTVHAFVHLVDQSNELVAQLDQGPASLGTSPELWLPGRTYADHYRIRVPVDSSSGVLEARVGMYDFDLGERLPARTSESEEGAGHFPLPSLKVLAEPPRAEMTPVDAQVGDFARITGYALEPAGAVAPGANLTVTLRYRSEATTGEDLTRFLQLYSEESGMAAQHDSLPQEGANPTWSWIPGETVVERIVLPIPTDAAAGEYTVLVGLYDLETRERTPLRADGQPLPDDALPLAPVTISALPPAQAP